MVIPRKAEWGLGIYYFTLLSIVSFSVAGFIVSRKSGSSSLRLNFKMLSWPTLPCCFKSRCKECMPHNLFTLPLYELPIHLPLLMCHLFPALICTVQALIASLASSFLFLQLHIVLAGLPVFWTTCFLYQPWPVPKESGNWIYLFCSVARSSTCLGPLSYFHILRVIFTWRLLPHILTFIMI